MKLSFFTRDGRVFPVFAGVGLFSALLLPIGPARAEASAPIKLALFDFELEDTSAAATLPGSATDAKDLALATNEARRLIAGSARYALVDTAGADSAAAKEHWLRKCNGCDADLAAKLGADQSLVGVVTRVSRTEYWVRYQIRDAHTGDVVSSERTELRLGANYSWDRGTRWLIENRLLVSQGPQ